MHKVLTETALIEPDELLRDIGQSSLKILDASAAMPGETSPRIAYDKGHIPGARFFDIEEISDHRSDLPHMLPSAEAFADYVSALGIKNTDTVIVYGQAGIVMGPARAWWMFRTFGHDNVRVLNGGLPAWKSLGFPVKNTSPPPVDRTSYQAYLRTDLLCDKSTVKQAVDTDNALILDARPADRFYGRVPEPRPGLKSGHIPGSVSMPCSQLVDTITGKMKTKAELEAILAPYQLSADKPVITTCGSGVTACVIALALHETGYPDAPVYDGSWSEWGQPEHNLPVETE
ncbi:MAG: 3-mercaptopyruvate sulfurtransferase [Alphaproteobacteria bacterium]|nr:3-mercaptopyruvate sulfurtransferase [Alphaproteobacteria bacterium]